MTAISTYLPLQMRVYLLPAVSTPFPMFSVMFGRDNVPGLRPAVRINLPRPIYTASPPAPTIPAKRKKRPTPSSASTSRDTIRRTGSPSSATQAQWIDSPSPPVQGGSRAPSSANAASRMHTQRQPSNSVHPMKNGARPTAQVCI